MAATLGLLAVVLAVSSAALSSTPIHTHYIPTPEPCYGEGCTNFTFFLGPRFGSKTLRLPIRNNTELKESNVEEINRDGSNSWVTNSERINETAQDSMQNTTIVRALFPRHRPVPEDGSLAVDYLDVDRARFILGADEKNGTTGAYNNTAIHNVSHMLDSGFLNMSGCGYTGEQAKQALYNLSSSSLSRLRQLSLSRNQVRSLPKMFFPVEMEYGLHELILDDNPLGRLNTSTRFELSRLANLKKLSLARTGLLYLDSPFLPSLEVLDLSGNELTYFPNLRDPFLHLQHLNLSGNHITYLECYVSLYSLLTLDLSSNGLKTIKARTIPNKIAFLETLYLNNNSLQYSYQIEDLTLGTWPTLYLAGNPWECSCPLVQVLHRQYGPVIEDKEFIRCSDENIRVPWPAMSLREVDVTVACPPRGVNGWLKGVGSKCDDVLRWFRYHLHITFSTFFTFLWWALLIGIAVAVARILRRQQKEYSPSTVPYTILDEKNII